MFIEPLFTFHNLLNLEILEMYKYTLKNTKIYLLISR